MAHVSLSIDVPPLLLDGSASKFRLNFSSSLHLLLPNSSWLTDFKWRELEVVRGPGFCLKVKFRWRGQRMGEALIEELGEKISRAEMWPQLLFSASLEVPERVQAGIDANRRSEVPGPDIIVLLVRASQLPAATELLLPKIIPTAFFSDITLNFLFSPNESDCFDRAPPSTMELMPQIDMAIRGLWSNKITHLSPILGRVGYLESVCGKSEYISIISDAIASVGRISRNRVLERSIETLSSNGELEIKLWKCLLGSSNKKGRAEGILKSLMVAEEGPITGNFRDNEDILSLHEGDFEKDKQEELLFDDISEDENSLFAWNEEGECGKGGESDSLFGWDDEHGTPLLEAPRSQAIGLKSVANGNDLLFSEDHESETFFEFEASLQNVEGRDPDMMLI